LNEALHIIIYSKHSKHDIVMKSYVITIGREFGCGAREIGQLVAKQLGIAYYDKELLNEAARASGVSADFFVDKDERAPRFFNNLWSFNTGFNTGAYFVGKTPLSDDNIYRAQSEVMQHLADKGPCVIVGRTADYILRDHCKVISVFIHASMDARIKRIIERGDCNTEEQAEQMANKQNKLRAEYYNFYTDKHWGAAASYDLCIDSSVLGTEATAKFIIDFVNAVIGKEEE